MVIIDTATGGGTVVGATGFSDVRGLTFDPDTSTLYGSEGAAGNLIRIDTGTGQGIAVGVIGASPVEGLALGSGDFDLLTVIRHEIGHSIGWQGAFPPNPNPLVEAHISGTTFDPSRLNIAMDTAMSAHSCSNEFPNDLMNPTLEKGGRRSISLYPAASLPARAFYHGVTMRYVDASTVSLQKSGTATHPWEKLSDALDNEPAGTPLLLIPGVYQEPTPLTIDEAHRIEVARGGSATLE